MMIERLAAYYLLVILFVFGSGFSAWGQSGFRPEDGLFIPKWLADQKVMQFMNQKAQINAPACEGCTYDEQISNLPFYEVLIPLPDGQDYSLSGVNGTYDEQATAYFNYTYRHPNPNIKPFGSNEWYPSQPVVLADVVTIRKKKYRPLRYYPIQVHKSGRTMRKYDRITYNITKYNIRTNKAASRIYAATSVLASGEWFKVGLTQDGLYRIDKNLLNQLGVNTNNLDPRKIRIFGHGGGLLPQDSRIKRIDDLRENPIYVEGESDGVFNDGDYILFYGQGPHTTYYDAKRNRLRQQKHVYCDTAYYFINVNQENGKRISTINGPSVDSWQSTSRQLSYWHEDMTNLEKAGRLWVGDNFDFQTTRNYTFSLPDLSTKDTVRLRLRVLARAAYPTTFTVRESGTTLGSIPLNEVSLTCSWCTYADIKLQEFVIPASRITDGRLDLELTYNKSGVSTGWLDYVEVEYVRNNTMSANAQFIYVIGKKTTGIELQNIDPSVTVWDITDPTFVQKLNYNLTEGNAKFGVVSDSIKKFFAFRTGGALVPNAFGRVANQNLHGLPQAEYLMVVHPEFMSQAQQLADLHRTKYNRTVTIVTPQLIYNEFSSGAADISAIRDFVKMFYDRGDTAQKNFPKYLLLFGDGSYDYKNIKVGGNYIPAYQAYESLFPPSSYTSDDFFGFLDDNEGRWWEGCSYEEQTTRDSHRLDIGIGRIPAHSTQTAQDMVNKIIHYVSVPETFGDWRNRILYVGDYKKNENIHIRQAELLSRIVNNLRPCIHAEKVFLDGYPSENTAEGMRFPLAKRSLLDQLGRGSVIVNYTGHGGETGLSNASLFEIPDIQALTNKNNLGFWITATCEFGRYDEPERTCGAEHLFLNPNGGAIGLLTSVREVFSDGNYNYNKNIYESLFHANVNPNALTFGDIQRLAKNASFSASEVNTRNFVLLGDPGLYLNLPQYRTVVTRINNQAINPGSPDTLRALGLVTVEGEIRNLSDDLITDFNGEISPTVYDKQISLLTFDGKEPFTLQNSIIFKGAATVTNGKFSFQFRVPLDISYEVGKGKINLYAQSNTIDAAGCTRDVVVCCTDSNAAKLPQNPPTVELFLNDEHWIAGSLTNQSPLLIAKLNDALGINTTGVGIGRELTAILDGNESQPIILNDFYKAKKDSYKEGQIQYRLRDIPEGEHSIRVKAWNVINLSGTDETQFIVASDAKLALKHIVNYPNPFTTSTRFFFNHNKVGENLDVSIKIYTVAGRLVKAFRERIFAQSSIFDGIEWDGLDEYGDKIGRGVYVYEIKVSVPNTGESVSEYEKLVLLK